MKPKIRQVYVPISLAHPYSYEIFNLYNLERKFVKTVAKEKGYFFTPEELKGFISDIIKESLETAYQNAYYSKDFVENITGSFDEIFNKFKL